LQSYGKTKCDRQINKTKFKRQRYPRGLTAIYIPYIKCYRSYWTHWSHATELLPLFINYGQVNAVRQQEAATAVCQHLQLPSLAVVNVAALAGLYSGMQRGEERHHRAPFRNLMLVTLGASVAAEQGASHIALAVNKEHHEARSEDATLSFLGRAESVLHSLEPPISLLTPLVHLTTPQVVQLVAEQANAPLDLTWSCKGGGEKHCSVCLGCRVRKEALESV
jgi:7-cyano-7-deazaguanine synthase